MALNKEWRARINRWRDELPRHFVVELGKVDLEGFVTKDKLTPEQAMEREFRPMPAGTPWGGKWDYGWFRASFTLPAEAQGRRAVLLYGMQSGGVGDLVWVNGQLLAERERHRPNVLTIADPAEEGASYEILAETYASHGPWNCHAGPTPPGRDTVPEPPETQVVTGPLRYGYWQEDVYQLWVDVETLLQLRDKLDEDELRVAEIDVALRDFTCIADFECSRDEMLQTVRAARERLKPLLECRNGSTAPTLYAYGHAHIDVAWLWPLAETTRKTARTFANALLLTRAYPEFKFLQSQPHLYRMCKQDYPELYERVVQAVADGRILAEGGMWVEADTNVSGGESLVRQFIHGKRFYREELGVECEMLWLPDVFGYSGAMPQIMRGCGVKYFSTAKIYWNYHGGDPFPYDTFTWEGIDGSEVLVHLCTDYNSQAGPEFTIERWRQRRNRDGTDSRLFPFGWGDGGGGPTRDHVEFLRRQVDLEGAPRCRIASPVEYFEDAVRKGWPEERYVGELYYQCHRGTYTSQARTKRGNRKCELGLREAEMWAAAAAALAGYEVPAKALDEAWKMVLLNQFHDIIPGSSIHRVYEEAEAMYADVLDTACRTVGEACAALTDDSSSMTVFNSLNWPRTALVALPEGATGAVDADGNALPVQAGEDGAEALVELPSCGWTTVTATDAAPADEEGVVATANSLENDLLAVEFDERGAITSIFDKETGREWATGTCNALKMYKDVPTVFDAWDIDSSYVLNPVELAEPAAIRPLCSGPLVGRVEIVRKIGASTLTQVVELRQGSRRVEFQTVVDWRESHKLLKVAFPVDVHANEAVHEIQFGHLARPNHFSRPFDKDRFEVCNHKWTALMEPGRGFAVLNDCKYGVNVAGNTINLTLLKSPLAPDQTADKGRQEFTYAFYAWNGPFAESNLVREGYELNAPVALQGGAAGTRSLFGVDAPNVVIETVKPAEDGSGDVVVRLYESMRMGTCCTLTTSLPVAEAAETNMLETEPRPARMDDGGIVVALRPFEIKTLRLKLKSGS